MSRWPRPGRAWERFWFEPTSTSTLALLRIGYGSVLLAWALFAGLNLRTFYSDWGVTVGVPPGDYIYSLFHYLSSDLALFCLYGLLVAAAICLILGFFTRVSAVVAFVILYSFIRRDPYVDNAGDRLLLILGFYMLLAPSGSSLSLDRWRRHRDRFWDFPNRSPWVLRLFQLQFCVIYLFTTWEKVRGASWNNGTAVAYALGIRDLIRFPVPEVILDNLVIINLLTWATLAIELALAILVWNRALRPWVLAAGVALHLSIDLTILVGFFSFGVFVTYIAWVPPETADRFILAIRDRLRSLRRRRPKVDPMDEPPDPAVPEPAVPEPAADTGVERQPAAPAPTAT